MAGKLLRHLIEGSMELRMRLILFLIISSSTTTTLSLPHILSLYTSWPPTTVWRAQGEVDVFLGIQTHDVRRDVHDLLAHSER